MSTDDAADTDTDARDDALARQARLHHERHRRWLSETGPPVARRLAQIGVLGWLIVLPILAGILGGRWLDGVLRTGQLFTAALLMVGVVVGGWSAWKWMHSA